MAIPIAMAAIWFWQDRSGTAQAAVPKTAAVVRTTLEDRISALGVLQPLQAIDVGTQVSGLVDRLHVQLGDTVRTRQLLAEIDPTSLSARVAVGRGGLRSLRAQLQDKLAMAELARQQQDRNQKLAALDAVSNEVLQTSQAALGSALAQVEALKAQIEQAQAQLASDEASLGLTRIVAPMSGTVVTLAVRPGQTLVANQQAPVLLRIADLSRMTVWAQVSEADVPLISPGMLAEFNTLGQPERRWTGQVRQVLPTPESVNGVVLYQVLFDVDNPDGALKPQMTAQVSFLRHQREGALVIPSSSLRRKPKAKEPPTASEASSDAPSPSGQQSAGGESRTKPGKGYLVEVMDAQGQVQSRKVRIGLQIEGQAEVLTGLLEGERVVIEPDPNSSTAKKRGGATKVDQRGPADSVEITDPSRHPGRG
jgi:macrolide-specific efflux system membrane fusion protein